MRTKIYDIIKEHGFKIQPNSKKDNESLSILKSFIKEGNYYIEVYKEPYGHSVMLFGDPYMSGYFPKMVDIVEPSELLELQIQLVKSKVKLKQ